MGVKGLNFCELQDVLSPNIINIISSRQVMRVKEISMKELLVDLIPNSLS